jgi:hypothetical protein
MTPERRAEIEDYIANGDYDPQVGYDIAEDCLTEIDALTAELAAKDKAVDQAIGAARLRLSQNGDAVYSEAGHTWTHTVPDLAAELRKREGKPADE